MEITNKYKGMKRIIITFIIICCTLQVKAQLNASQIKKDGVTIVANSLNQIVCDTVNKIATKYDVASGGGGGSGTVTSVGTGLGLTGGTITTTGTISLDTASSVVLSRQRADNTYETKSIYKVLESDGTSTKNVLVVASDGTNTFEFIADSASIYIIECWLVFTTNGTSGLNVAINTTGTTTSSYSITGSSGSTSAVRYQVNTYNGWSATFASFIATANAYVRMEGSLITPGTGGLVQVVYRDNNAGQYVNAVAGSWMRVKKIK